MSLFSSSCEKLPFPLLAGLRKDIGVTNPTASEEEEEEGGRARRLLKGGGQRWLENMLS